MRGASIERRLGILINGAAGTVAGGGKENFRAMIAAACAAHGLSPELHFPAGDDLESSARAMLARLKAGELDAVAVGGGDGSVRTVAAVFAGSGYPFGVLPLGTLNHFAKDLGLPLELEAALGVVAAGHVAPVDAGEVNGAIFINNSSIGLYPYMVIERERRRRHGLPKWPAMALAALRVLRFFPLRRLRVAVAGNGETLHTPCVFVGNNDYVIGGSGLGTRARLDGGNLSIHVSRPGSRLALLRLIFRLILARVDPDRDLDVQRATSAEIASRGRRRLLVACDGEVVIMRAPLRYAVLPGALRVFAPRSNAALGEPRNG